MRFFLKVSIKVYKMKLPKIFNNKTEDEEEYFSDEFVLATDYLEKLVIKFDTNIKAISMYLLHNDPFNRIEVFYIKQGNDYDRIIHSIHSNLTPLHYNFFAEAIENHSYEQDVQDSFKNTYSNIYLKKKELSDIEIDPFKLAIISDTPQNGSLASFLSFFNIPQISALIIGIDFEHIYFADETYAYFSHKDKYDNDHLEKFTSSISFMESEVLNNAFDGFNIDYYSENNKSLDLIKSTICRRGLEKYLAKSGYSLNDLIKKQSTLATDAKRIKLLEQQVIEQNAEIEEKQDQIVKLTTQLTQTYKVVDDDKEITYNSQTAITRLLNILFHMGDYDIEAHSGTTNKKIVSYSNLPNINTPVTKNFVTTWIKNVQRLRDETQEQTK